MKFLEAFPLGIQVAAWVLLGIISLMFGLLLFFGKRFISDHDSFKKDVKDRFDSHAKKVDSAVEKIEASASKMGADAFELKQANLNFQIRVNQELGTIQKRSNEIERTLDRTSAKADDLEVKFDKHIKQVETMNQTLNVHDIALRKGAAVLKGHRKSIDETKDTVRTIVEEVGNLTFLRTRRTPRGDNGGGEKT